MVEFSDLARPDLGELLGFETVNGSGLQGAHVNGKRDLAPYLERIFEYMNSDLTVGPKH